MITTVDNFTSIVLPEADQSGTGFRFGDKDKDTYYFDSSAQVNGNICVNLGQYKNRGGKVFSMGERDSQDDNLIVSISKGVDDKYVAKTGNYVGKFTWDGLRKVDIRSRFPHTFMRRMLNFANDIFLDEASVFDADKSDDLDVSKLIIFYLFIQKLEKAFLLGIPKAYQSVYHHDMKLKGRIDINRFIKRDIPFQGKVASVSREQKEIQEIIDVLFKAVQVIEKHDKLLLKNINHIKTHLKHHKSRQYVSNIVIQKARDSKALQNPIFAPYKSILEYAKLIINRSNLEEKRSGKEKTCGFLVNVAELFEIYVTKLLQRSFPDWDVSSPHESLYPNQFYKRKIIPDIVMKHRYSNALMVFDTKYKRMLMRGTKERVWDVDRNDFFQINTYMSYYQNHLNTYKLLAGGLLYPMEAPFNEKECHSDSWFGNVDVKFVVDGIDLSGDGMTINKIKKSEEDFIHRIKDLGTEKRILEQTA